MADILPNLAKFCSNGFWAKKLNFLILHYWPDGSGQHFAETRLDEKFSGQDETEFETN